MFAHVYKNNKFSLVKLDENNIATSWELDKVGQTFKVNDDEIVVKYNSKDKKDLHLEMEHYTFIVQNNEFSDNVIENQYELAIREQIETTKKYPSKILSCDKTIQEKGVQRINNFIPEEMADRLRKHIVEKLDTCQRDKDIDPLPYGKKRDDLILQREGVVDEVVNLMFPKFEEVVGKKIIGIEEIRSLINYPGSTRQWIHRDSNVSNTYAFFVATQNVTPDLGPTMFFPGTHSIEAYKKFADEDHNGSTLHNSQKAIIDKGDAFIYHHRVLHCGTENISDTIRILFYMTCEVESNEE